MNGKARRERLRAEYAVKYEWWRQHIQDCPRCYTALATGCAGMACAAHQAALTQFVREAAFWRSVQRSQTLGASA